MQSAWYIVKFSGLDVKKFVYHIEYLSGTAYLATFWIH